jgi:hypothetical protein
VAQDRVKWRALENTVVNLRLRFKSDTFVISCATVSFSGRLWSVELVVYVQQL